MIGARKWLTQSQMAAIFRVLLHYNHHNCCTIYTIKEERLYMCMIVRFLLTPKPQWGNPKTIHIRDP